MKSTVFGVVAFTLGLAVLVSALVSIPVYFLWNGCLVGAINGVNEITWLQGWGITLLANVLFKTTVETKK
jgi:hypothetical protein